MIPPYSFNNYEITKLQVSNPDMSNMLIFLFLLAITVATSHKSESELLDRSQTNQLKGLAILFVILGHLWVHVSQATPAIYFSAEAVGIFFFLSGYGLTLSNQKRVLGLKEYLTRRVKRVMIPYWFATIFILLMDFFLLDRTYGIRDIISTFSGINVTLTTRHIDYVRWYITLLLVWYFLFFLVRNHLAGMSGILFLFFSASVLFIADYYIFHFGWYQLFSFPAGCLAGKYRKVLFKILGNRLKEAAILAGILFIFYIYYKANLSSALSLSVPWIVYKFIGEILTVLFTVCFVIFVAMYGVVFGKSYFLQFIGIVSYELFLLHGAFLVKYNPVISNGDTLVLLLQFVVFLFFISAISWVANKSSLRIV